MKNQKLMFKLVLSLLLFSTFFSNLNAQASPEMRKREIGLQMSGINNFGVIYKYRLKDNKYRRFRVASGNINVQDAGSTSFNMGLNIALGSEKRVRISDKAKLLHGPEFSGGFNFSYTNNSNSLVLNPGVGYVLGFLYQPNEKFNISLEGMALLRTTYQFVSGNDDLLDSAALSLQFNSSNVTLNFIYCFETQKKVKKGKNKD